MELSGQLSNFELVDLLQMIGISRNTGTLIVRGNDEWVALVIRAGKLERILSRSISYESFGELLIEAGVFDPETLDDILSIQRTSGSARRLGELLADYGVDKTCIDNTVIAQIRSLITHLLTWKDGSFSIHINTVPNQVLSGSIRQIVLDQPLELIDLLLWAAAEIDELQRAAGIAETGNIITNIGSFELEKMVASLSKFEEQTPPPSSTAFQLPMVRAFNGELRLCATQQEVLMLMLRAAGNAAGRGLFIQVDGNELYNLGCYNAGPNSAREEFEFQEDMISVDEQALRSSILGQALAAGQALHLTWSEPEDENIVNRWLLSRLGGKPQPGARAFLIPVESEGGTLVLYGDDLAGPVNYDLLAEVEVMLAQAALTLERLRLVHLAPVPSGYAQAA